MSFTINATPRVETGSGASRRLRRASRVPAIVYGGNQQPEMIELDHNEILLSLAKEAFHSSVLNLNMDGKQQSVLLRDTQMHPYKPLVQHVDFMRVEAKQPITVNVPLHFLNQESAPGVKLYHGLIAHTMTEVQISCLPKDLPQYIEVDLGEMQVGESVHVLDLELPEGVSLAQHVDQNPVVVSITAKRGKGMSLEEEEEGPAEAETAEEDETEEDSGES